MTTIAQQLKECFDRGNKAWICGNGGSSAEASHFSEELISLGYPLIALNDPQVITALSNDFSYDQVFSRYLLAVASEGDILIVLSTSGKSKNCIRAIRTAKQMCIEVVDFPRKGKTTEIIQNNQLALIHRIYEDFKHIT